MNSKQNVLITGASSGFGKLTAQTLAGAGHQVFATMRGADGKNLKQAQELLEWAGNENASIKIQELDVTSSDSIKSAVDKIISEHERIDVVVNNAGVASAGLTESFTVEDAQKMFDINFFGVMRVNRAIIPHMRNQKSGLLIHISTTTARLPFPYMGPYAPSKAAMEAYAESLKYELAHFGIDSLIIEPGAHPTDIFDKMISPSDISVVSGYGEDAHNPQKMFEGMRKMLAGPQAPDPSQVAQAVKNLVDQPAGQRPLRTVVDRLTGSVVEGINKNAETAQTQLLKAFGIKV